MAIGLQTGISTGFDNGINYACEQSVLALVPRFGPDRTDLLSTGPSDQVQILGPTPKPIARTHNLFHYQILLKYRFEDQLPQVLNQILDYTQERENQDLRVSIDNEPQSFM